MPELGFAPTNEQSHILSHDPQADARVLAGPGTGKSATLVAYISLLLQRNPRPRIRLLTFTRAATAELAQKVAAHPVAAVERPSTIHSFAISVLLRNPGSGDFPEPLRIADDWEYKRIVRKSLARRVDCNVGTLDRLVTEMASNWESLGPEEDPNISPELRRTFLGAWQEHRQILGYTLLGELPYALRHALHNHEDLDGVNYDLLVVDEYQDLNACDLEVLALITERGTTIIGAGDDDQSIYSFRRALPAGIRRFPEDYPDAADYTLSVTQRCAARIIEWAADIIEADPDRPTRPRLEAVEGAPRGEVALLSFNNQLQEAKGIARLTAQLIEQENLQPSDILVLLKADHQGVFSKLIKEQLDEIGIDYSDPDYVRRLLGEEENRRLLSMLRLLVHDDDSLAWAALLRLEAGVGDSFFWYIYKTANESHVTLGKALLGAYANDFPEGPQGSKRRAGQMIEHTLEWLSANQELSPNEEGGWGAVIEHIAQADETLEPSSDFIQLLQQIDQAVEDDITLERYLGQIEPLGRDLAQAESPGVRIMTMAGAKGLTVRATIVAACEEGIIPRPHANRAEERRLLYVAMTRARQFLYVTWARSRTGPTARAGRPRVGTHRRFSSFLDAGNVQSQSGSRYLDNRW